MIRPQQRRMKQHQEMLGGLKRGDNIVLSSGVYGKIVRVEDATVGVEIATGVTVKVRKAMITEVEARGTPAPANDSKV
jgi:preprotein translocase subunit YajC